MCTSSHMILHIVLCGFTGRSGDLGHSTIAITLGIYSHVAPTLHDEAAELVADLIL